MKESALLIVDIQNDYFPAGKFELEGADEAAVKAAEVLAEFRKNELPVFHIRHENLSDNPMFFAPGSDGAKIHDSVLPSDGESVIVKNFPNSFKGTELEHELQAIGAKKVAIVGMMTLMCIDATSRAAKDLGFEVVVISDACAGRALEFSGVKVSASQVNVSFFAALQMSYADVMDAGSFLE